MKSSACHFTPAALAALCLLILSGCMSNTATNMVERGSPATEAEVAAHLSGNFVRLQQGGTFFAADGTLQSVGPGGDEISVGTWSDALCMTNTYYFAVNGQTDSYGPDTNCYFIWINDDGTAIADPVGNGPNLDLARPERGFPIQARFNALRRNLGV